MPNPERLGISPEQLKQIPGRAAQVATGAAIPALDTLAWLSRAASGPSTLGHDWTRGQQVSSALESLVRRMQGYARQSRAGSEAEIASYLPRPAMGAPILMMLHNAAKEEKAAKGLEEFIRVYHGTGAKPFAKFSREMIGTGEGSAAYGHGLYFAEEPGVANRYQAILTGSSYPSLDTLKRYFEPGKVVPSYGGFDKVLGFEKRGKRWRVRVQAVRKSASGVWEIDPRSPAPRWHKTAPDAKEIKRALGQEAMGGAVVQARIKAKPEHFLDWDKPLNEQSEFVKEALTRWRPMSEHGGPGALFSKKDLAKSTETAGEWYRGTRYEADPEAISGMLHEVGIPGIRYFDQGSRDARKGTRNLVLFDENLAEITHINNIPLKEYEKKTGQKLAGILAAAGIGASTLRERKE